MPVVLKIAVTPFQAHAAARAKGVDAQEGTKSLACRNSGSSMRSPDEDFARTDAGQWLQFIH